MMNRSLNSAQLKIVSESVQQLEPMAGNLIVNPQLAIDPSSQQFMVLGQSQNQLQFENSGIYSKQDLGQYHSQQLGTEISDQLDPASQAYLMK